MEPVAIGIVVAYRRCKTMLLLSLARNYSARVSRNGKEALALLILLISQILVVDILFTADYFSHVLA